MNSVTQSRIASALTAAVGVWLLVSPLFISISGNALISQLIVGGVIAVAGLVQIVWENTIPSWVNAAAAIWLIISTFLFSASTAAVWSAVIAAAATLVLATWDGIEVDQLSREHHAQA